MFVLHIGILVIYVERFNASRNYIDARERANFSVGGLRTRTRPTRENRLQLIVANNFLNCASSDSRDNNIALAQLRMIVIPAPGFPNFCALKKILREEFPEFSNYGIRITQSESPNKSNLSNHFYSVKSMGCGI